VSIEIRIVCDGCMITHAHYGWSSGPNRKKAHQLRKELREKLQWAVGVSGRDLCWHCWQAERLGAKRSRALSREGET